jgi:hypothetical protein
MKTEYQAVLKYKLIYVFRINNKKTHDGCLKIGETTCESNNISALKNNCDILNEAAHKRIKTYTQTAGIKYELIHTELAIYKKDGNYHYFSDKKVHGVLRKSGIENKFFDLKNKANEWFKTDLNTIKLAIEAVKKERSSLSSGEITNDLNPVAFRPEQEEAIDKAIKQFAKSNQMLWNAKMRFGKTLSALQVVKTKQFTRTLILTHRPVVNESWFDDFGKIFYDNKNYSFGHKKQNKKGGVSFENLEKRCKSSKGKDKYVFFASMQDLRGSSKVGGNFNKNDEIFSTEWDFLIIDEAHEGMQTLLGENVQKELIKSKTKVLRLSGTPFNLLDNYSENEIFTWDYTMEQRAKEDWDKKYFGDPNPYSGLPKMNIFTFDLGKLLNKFNENAAFNFHEFFKVDAKGQFIHEADVMSFLNLITKTDSSSNYPYSKKEYRDLFNHSLWMVPGVKEARALSKLLNEHRVFGAFEIVNVAGEGDVDEEKANYEALEKVEAAIGEKPNETYTITLSCGRLTTGVSVPAWSAVFMMSGSFNTSASSYMQTIFRVQTPATINGKVKENCYVFDFAPDRTLKVIAETAKISSKAGKTTVTDRQVLGSFLNFCPIISIDGSKMKAFDVDGMLQHLKKVYVERVVKNGFDAGYLYNSKLLDLKSVDYKKFESLQKIIGKTKAMPKTGDININSQGFTDEEYEELYEKRTNKKELSKEELRLLKEKEEKKKKRDTAISILRGISIRMPMLIYGANVSDEEEITIDNFTSLIDEQSWEEFMPKGVSKAKFNSFKEYYEPDIFRAAGKKIRSMTKDADNLSIEERISSLVSIFSTFRNPDKETVLTPWRIVNMHISDCLGGHVFFNEKFDASIGNPRFVSRGDKTKSVFASDTRILEINSKSGLYPLFMAYNVYRTRLIAEYPPKLHPNPTLKQQQLVWDKVLEENIFVICKTPMAESITRRTLGGYRKSVKINALYYNNLVPEISSNPDMFMKRIHQGKTFWKTNKTDKMKFNAIVGNPPYQEMDGGSGVSAKPIYNYFVDVAKQIEPDFISLIIPARWYAGGKGLDEFRKSMLNDKRISSLFDFPNDKDCFPNADIAGGVCYFLWDKNHSSQCLISNYSNGKFEQGEKRSLNEFEILIRQNKSVSILHKVLKENKQKKFLSDRVSSRKPFGLPTNYKPHSNGIPCWFIQKIGLKYALKKDVTDSGNYLDKWKLLIPPAPIAGQTDFTKPIGFYYDGNTRIAKPGECCTESYIIAGAFETQKEVISFKSYLFTKVVRFLLLQTVVSQHVTKEKFKFIPDLGKYEGKYTDEALCKLWKITKEEWLYIDSRINNIK